MKFLSKKVFKRVGLKQYHHFKIDKELSLDCATWILLFKNDEGLTRPFIDFKKNTWTAQELLFYSDASRAEKLGFGAIFNKYWTYSMWEDGYTQKYQPSMEYLELYAMTVTAYLWLHMLCNKRIIIYCDNASVISMINRTGSSSKNRSIWTKAHLAFWHIIS